MGRCIEENGSREADAGSEIRTRYKEVLENRVLRRVFGSKRDEVTGEWRKLHNEGLSDLYFSPMLFG
jgi:hypothetical protein